MNDVYFACRTCKTYQDAGYRWCYWQLERTGIVTDGEPVDVEAVLAAEEFWTDPALDPERKMDGLTPERRAEVDNADRLLRRILPKIREFLEKHREHDLFYTEAHVFWNDDQFDWMDEDEEAFADKSPRYFVERLGFDDWQQVFEYHRQRGEDLAMVWLDESECDAARLKFETLVREQESRQRAKPN